MKSFIQSSQCTRLMGLLILAGIAGVTPQLVMSHPVETNVTVTPSEQKVSENQVSQATETDQNPNSAVVQAFEFQPPDRGAPGTRADAGSRGGNGQCSQLQKPMTALIPTTNLGETLATHPTFWVYVPTRSATVELILQEPTSQEVLYEVKFPVTQGPGVVSFQLPKTAPPLEEGKAYRWMFNFFCSPASVNRQSSEEQSDFTVSGVVARITPSTELSQQLKKASQTEKIALYAQNGLWYETVTQLGELRRTQPLNAQVTSQWTNLLQHQAVRLNSIAEEPVLACCDLKQKNSWPFLFQGKAAKSIDSEQ
ncbi:MAG: DUF928 domain-containing protein [Cyanobacteriota bacterium]|nr:DUF928 domain-containing protein [Cyanobacteriota bacterium]